MSYSNHPRTNRSAGRAPARRSTRRVNIAIGQAATDSSPLANLWHTRRTKFIALGLMLVIGLALFLMFDLDMFYVYDFEIAGTRYLTADEIERASGVQGYNIFFVDARSVEHALAKLPEVKSVRVKTGLPGYVSVQIDERKPEINWLRGNELYWVDLNGVGFRARVFLPELPTIRDLDQASIKLGERVNPEAVNAFWAFRAAYPEGPRSIEWSLARGLSFTDERGWKIYLGDANEMAGKLAKLRALVAQLVAQNARIRFIDLGKGEPYYQ